MILENLIKDSKNFDSYLKKFNREPEEYPTVADKFIELANIMKIQGRLSQHEIILIESLNFESEIKKCKSLFEVGLKCLFLNYDSTRLPFEFLRSNFENISVYVIGGSAAYIHILAKTLHAVPLADIDFCMVAEKEQSNQEIFDTLVNKLDQFCIDRNCSYEFIDNDNNYSSEETRNLNRISIGYVQIYQNGDKYIKLNYFINQIPFEDIPELEVIAGLNVVNFNGTYDEEKINFELAVEMTQGETKSKDEGEYQMFLDKLPRKQEIMTYLNNLK